MPVRKPAKPRADALRNRERVLAVAAQVFANEGAAAPMEEIARRAGLGVGTLYRHFPTKAALLEAIVGERLRQVSAAALNFERAPDPAAALFEFLAHLIEESAVRRDLSDVLSGAGFDWQRATGALDVRQMLGKLLARAQRAKRIRRDLSLDELLALLAAMLVALERFEGQERSRTRVFAIFCDGMRA